MATPAISRADARAKGLKRYFTGKPCKHEHVAERIVANGGCVSCLKAIESRHRDKYREKFRAKWRRQSVASLIKNPERVRRNRKRWSDANPIKRRAIQKACRDKNPETYKKIDQKWRQANPEKVRAKLRNYRDANVEKLRILDFERVTKWRKANPEKVRKLSQARRARKSGASGSHTAEQLLQLLERQHFKCAGCITSIKDKRHIDHIMPLARGGSNDIRNLQWLCPVCNNKKHAKDPIAWAQENGRLL